MVAYLPKSKIGSIQNIETDKDANILENPQPCLILRESTFEDYVKYHKEMGSTFNFAFLCLRSDHQFYEVSTD